jgi:hypothetical protein
MASNSSSEYKVVADKIVSPDEDIIVSVAGAMYKDSITEQNRYATMADVGEGGGGAANIADFVFNYDSEDTDSTMTIHNHDMVIRTTRDGSQDADISINSANDVWITADDEIDITSTNNEVRIITGADGQNIWKFRQDGLIGTDGNSGVEALDSGDVKGRLKFEPSNGRALLQAYGSNDTATFTTEADWDTATWTETTPGFSDLTLTNASGIISFMDNTGYQVDVLKISVNGGIYGIYNGASSGDGAITFNIEGITPEGEVTVTEIQFQYAFSAKVDIDFDERQLVIRTEDEMDTIIDSDSTLTLRSRNDFTRVQANRDVTFTANYGEDSQYVWKMRQDGRFELPTEGYVKGLFGNSSDGLNNDTIEVIPDFGLYDDGGNQYLVIEPTMAPTPEEPTHIHIRPGGTVDASTTDLILGGERNNVVVSDTYKSVGIRTAYQTQNSYVNLSETSGTQFVALSTADIQTGYIVNVGGTVYTVNAVTSIDEGIVGVTATGAVFEADTEYTFVYAPTETNNQWTFGSNGVLSGPAMGGVRVPAITNSGPDDDLYINAFGASADIRLEADQDIRLATEYGNIIFNADGGEYIGSSSSPENQIATIGDIDSTVSNGMVRYSPTFTATGLAFTGSETTHPTYNSYYVKAGQMVSFVIEVDLTTVTNFGTGQYKLQLPFTPAFGFNHFSGWAWADPNVSPDTGTGHTIINADTAGVTDVLDLHYLKQAGGANSPIREGLFLQGTPVTLTTISKIYVNGTYIAAA